MTYTTKMSLALATIGTLTFVYSSHCEAKTPTFPPYYTCADIAGTGYNACMVGQPIGNPNKQIQDVCEAGRHAIKILCTD